MTFEEFLEKCREKDGWRLRVDMIRNTDLLCPLEAVFGGTATYGPNWSAEGTAARMAIERGLRARAIMAAADGNSKGEYRKALLGLVKP